MYPFKSCPFANATKSVVKATALDVNSKETVVVFKSISFKSTATEIVPSKEKIIPFIPSSIAFIANLFPLSAVATATLRKLTND